MVDEEYESTNIHLLWLSNIYKQITTLQDFERIAHEGCRDLLEYLEMPPHLYPFILPDAQYKNLRFMVMELRLLISNVNNVLEKQEKGKTEEYKTRLQVVLNIINNRSLFLKDVKQNNNVVKVNVLPMLNYTIEYISKLKADLIEDISSILYLPEAEGKKW